MKNALLSPILLSLLAGCAHGPDGFPSLASRPIERRGWAEPAVPAPAPVAADPALDAAVAASLDALRRAGSAFAEGTARAGRLTAAAHGQPEGSDRWVAAQAALAELDATRATTADAAADLSQRAFDRAGRGDPAYPALDAAQAAAEAQLADETARIAALSRPAR